MEFSDRHWWKKLAISLVFSLFVFKAEAGGIVVPTITAQPSNTSVQNGDTATFTMSAGCLLSAIGSVTWYCNSKPIYTNTFLVQLFSVNSTLTVNNVSSNNAGNYYAEVKDLLGGTIKTSYASLGIIPPVAAVTSGSAMMDKGFKLQFSGPVGSNLVIEATSDMIHWTPISTNVITSSGGSGGSVTYTDAAAKTMPGRFYRARLK